jgi:hypothetical protein
MLPYRQIGLTSIYRKIGTTSRVSISPVCSHLDWFLTRNHQSTESRYRSGSSRVSGNFYSKSPGWASMILSRTNLTLISLSKSFASGRLPLLKGHDLAKCNGSIKIIGDAFSKFHRLLFSHQVSLTFFVYDLVNRVMCAYMLGNCFDHPTNDLYIRTISISRSAT